MWTSNLAFVIISENKRRISYARLVRYEERSEQDEGSAQF